LLYYKQLFLSLDKVHLKGVLWRCFIINKVVETKHAQKVIEKIPAYVADKLNSWALLVEEYGLDEVRKLKGYHDEPLKGDLRGCRSIRLNRSYRAIYTVRFGMVVIEEVNKHEY